MKFFCCNGSKFKIGIKAQLTNTISSVPDVVIKVYDITNKKSLEDNLNRIHESIQILAKKGEVKDMQFQTWGSVDRRIDFDTSSFDAFCDYFQKLDLIDANAVNYNPVHGVNVANS